MAEVASFDVTAESSARAPAGKACASCGAPVEPFDRFCNACGASQPVPETAPVESQKHLRCQSCGAEIALDANHRSITCPFCDSNYVVEFSPGETGRQPPEFVIGFAVTPQDAMEKFLAWLKDSSWFRPGDLTTAMVADKLLGVYLPFWSFSMLARSSWTAKIGEYWYRTETYTTIENGKSVTKTRQVQETEWWPLAGKHHQYYSGYLVSGSRGLPQAEADRIKPFHLAGLKRYQPYFLAGWLSEEYSVERDAALETCEAEFQRQEQANVQAFLPGDTNSHLAVQTGFESINSDLVLLPIYLLSYRYGGKLYRFMLNGQTGQMDGDKPLSGKRIGIAVGAALLVAAIVALVVFLFNR